MMNGNTKLWWMLIQFPLMLLAFYVIRRWKARKELRAKEERKKRREQKRRLQQ